MRRIHLSLAYDGTAYHGWQFQPSEATVQGKLQEVLSDLLAEEVRIHGASRTDAGVHARGRQPPWLPPLRYQPRSCRS